ncbi:MAG: cellulase family glycosylhydrolase [Actinobacteria bacterium]|nr:cellulase family glycosylhydrolase [Actinomycetota bacterium]
MSADSASSTPTVRSPRRLALVVALALLAVATVAPSPATGAPTPTGDVADWSTAIGTDGRVYIADANGRALQFHGFNHKTDDPATLTDALLAAAAERGMDHVRLAIYWDRFEPTQDVWDEAYFDRVRAAMDRAEAHGIRVILDMHQDVYGARFGGAGIPDWATRDDGVPYTLHDVWLLNYLEPAVQNAFEHLYEDADLRAQQIEAWTEVVQRFSDHPALLGYDLLNEPFGKIRSGEDLLSAAARVEREQLTPMYQRLTDAISAIDPDHWVFIEPPNLASLGVATSLGRVDGPKVALYPHMYDSNIESATYTPGGVIEYDPAFFSKWADAITTYTDSYPVPMLVGEWGIARPEVPGMDAFVADSLETLDRVTSGWSVFNWCMGSGYCPLDAAGNDRPAIGQIFQPYARAIAGAPTSTRWDPDTKVLTVRFADNGATGTTDIYLNAGRSFPGGWTVDTSDLDADWSQSYDPATGVLSVTTPDTGGDHVICVQPEGTTAACAAVDATDTTDPTDSTTTPTATPATPVGGTGSYTG